jgi:hypothetical protein
MKSKKFKEYLKKLDEDHDRSGKPNLTNKERIERLNRIYDMNLISLEKSSALGFTKGTAGMMALIESARLEIKDLGGEVKDNVIVLKFDKPAECQASS